MWKFLRIYSSIIYFRRKSFLWKKKIAVFCTFKFLVTSLLLFENFLFCRWLLFLRCVSLVQNDVKELPLDNIKEYYQKQSPEAFRKKRCFQKFRKIHRETPVPESLFLRSTNLLKKRLWHKCFPVYFAKFLRTPFIIGHLWGLLLEIGFYAEKHVSETQMKNVAVIES